MANTLISPAPLPKPATGVHNSAELTKVTILDGSHHSACEDPKRDTVLILPDYKVVSEVQRSLEGAKQLWTGAVDAGVGRAGAVVEGSTQRSWVLPYSSVILLCSHKKRDNRCAIAAPKLQNGEQTCLSTSSFTYRIYRVYRYHGRS